MTTLSLTLFGSVRILLDGRPGPSLPTKKVEALLVYLATEEAAVQRRETLMTLLWPGMPERSARHNLRQTLYHLRKAIPEVDQAAVDKDERSAEGVPLILSNRQEISIHPEAAIQVDVLRFERLIKRTKNHDHVSLVSCQQCQDDLKEAIDLYQGDFLADFYLEDSNEFEEWSETKREYYRRRALDGLEIVATIATRQKAYVDARAYAEKQLDIDNLRESAYRQLMEVLALSGRREEALAVYENCRRLLAEELAMEPTAHTTRVYEKISAGDLRLDAPLVQDLKGYELKDVVGEGSYGTIRTAIQPTVDREVAVKVIRRRYANNPEFIRRFEAEAQTVARLEHPHIVPLYDYWRDPEGAYLVMRYMRGGSLLNALQTGPWDAEPAMKLMDQVASALNAAHQRGIVHRDIKPANILLDKAGNAYLSDFGIAKSLEVDGQLTAEGEIMGTPDYVSPEQILNQPVTPRTDIYSLGAVLYETLTGEKPYSDSSVANLIYKHLNEPVPQVSTSRPDLPPQIDEVIQRSTAKRPEDRYADALEMAEAFRQALGERRYQPADGEYAGYRPIDIPEGLISNPYKGLRAFQESDAGNFFGREALVDQMLNQLSRSRFLAIVGPSGSGKSSAVKAGLIPALREGAIPAQGNQAASDKWFVAEMVPGTHPFEELELTLWSIAVDPPPSLVEPMQKDTRGMLRTIRRVLPNEEGVQLLLVIDQLEELFTMVDDEERQKFFIDSLLAALRAPRSPLRVVATLRADFYDRPLQIEPLGRLLKANTEIILPMTAEELTWAVREPARRMGVGLEEGLTEVIVADVADQPGSLPLMQYALTELFERRQGRRMTRETYQEIGGAMGALGRRAERLYGKLNEDEQEAARQLFLRLVTLGEGIEDTRRRVLRSELLSLEGHKATGDGQQPVANARSEISNTVSRFSSVIDQFGAARLLTFDRDPATRGATVEVAHEALLREWGRYRSWLDESRDDIRLQQRLARAAEEWLAADKDESYLLRGARLAQFEGWSEAGGVAVTAEESDFLATSIDARRARQADEERRRHQELETARKLAETETARAEIESRRAEEQASAARRLRQRAIGLAALLVVAVVLAGAAVLFSQASRQQARLATARELSLAALNNLESDPELSMLLALQALDNSYTVEAEEALHHLLQASRALATLSDHTDFVQGAGFSKDGTLAATVSLDGTVKIWEAVSGELLHTLPYSGIDFVGSTLKFDDSGGRLALVAVGENLGSAFLDIWDVDSGEMLSANELATPVENFAVDLSPD
ncbi:MAG: protein kinase, partial [Chloroflexota bacterium]